MQHRRISFYWAQGADHAPDLVRRCWDAWARLNPNWEIVISDQTRAEQICDELGIHRPITFQGLGDIFRVHDIVTHGGLYIDAAVVPLRPLDTWLAELSTQGFFGFHDPYRRRSIESWFLYADPQNAIASAWLDEITRYWAVARRPQRLPSELNKGKKGALSAVSSSLMGRTAEKAAKMIEPKNRRWSVAPKGGAKRAIHPYFWLHYLFDHMLATQPEIRHAWGQVPKEPSYKSLILRHSQRDYAQMTPYEMDMLIRGSDMQKLLLDVLPSDALLDHLFAQAHQGS